MYIHLHIVERVDPSAFAVMLPGSPALCVSAEAEEANETRPKKTVQGEHWKQPEPQWFIHRRVHPSLTSLARDHNIITHDQKGVTSSLRTNRPRLTASIIALNNVIVVPNDSTLLNDTAQLKVYLQYLLETSRFSDISPLIQTASSVYINSVTRYHNTSAFRSAWHCKWLVIQW